MSMRFSKALLVSTCFVMANAVYMQSSMAASSAPAVPVVANAIGGVVTGPKGPEAGVWVIAETQDLPTRFIKIVVTDDQGRYLVPELPAANYKVWVRGYGLVDSNQVDAKPGKNINLTALPAPDAKTAAAIYPASYWFALIRPPAASEFPGTGPKGNGISTRMKTQQDWMAGMSEGCLLCHQLGDKATRELANNSVEGWADRIRQARNDGDPATGNVARSYAINMQNTMSGFGPQRSLNMFTDWTQRVAKGELPTEAPPRPVGLERNVVLSIWDWADGHQIHDEISTDRRNPTVNPNGRIYGVSTSTGLVQWLEPKTHKVGNIPIPGSGKDWDINNYPHNPMLDQRGRLWLTDSTRARMVQSAAAKGITLMAPLGTRADYCTDGKLNPSAKYYPRPGENSSKIHMYDPETNKTIGMDACFGTHHLGFGYDKDNTLYFSGDVNVVGWLNTKMWDETGGDLRKSEGWCPMVLDTKEQEMKGDVKITPDRTQWNEPAAAVGGGEEGGGSAAARPVVDAKKDTRITGFLYGMDASPKDGTMWYGKNAPAVPSGLVRFDRGSNPPVTCKTEYYEPPKRADGTYVAYDARGVGVDNNNLTWTTFGSGKMASLDRTKCKVMRGPSATGQHCAEGWTFYDIPGPKIFGAGDITADWSYLNWSDTFDTLGLGKDVQLAVGSNSDSLLALIPKTGKVMHFRVPYPIGFYSRGMDGRIDDPNTGWKGRGVWASVGTFPVWHQEGGDEGRGPEIVKFQVRPDPLAF